MKDKRYEIVLNVGDDFTTEDMDQLLNEGAFGMIEDSDEYLSFKIREIKEVKR